MSRVVGIACGVVLALTLALAPLGEGGARSANLALLQTLACLAALAAWVGRPRSRRPPPAALLLAAAFLAWCAVGTMRAPYRFGSFTTTADVAMAVTFLWAAWWCRPSPVWRLRLVGTVIAAGAAEAAMALWQRWVSGAPRGTGTFLNPNHLGAYLNVALALALARLLARRGRDVPAAAAAALCLAAQLTAVASRGALLAAFGVLGAAAVAAVPGRRRRAVALLAAGGLLIVAVLGLSQRFARSDDPYRYSRLQIWRASAGAVAGSPVFGIGPGMLRHLSEPLNFPRFEGPVRYGRSFRSAHSQVLEVAVETGLVGLTLFLGAAGAAAAAIRRRSRAAGTDSRGTLLALGTLAVQGLFDGVLGPPALALTTAVLVGASISPPRLPAVRPVRPRRPDPAVLLPAAGLLAAGYYALVVAPFLADLHFHRMMAATDPVRFRQELAAALRRNPYQPQYYERAAQVILASVPRLDPASYSICYDYAVKAAQLQPRDADLRLLRARVSARGFREVFHDPAGLSEARAQFEAAVELAPTDPRPAVALAAFLLDLGRGDEALDAADAALAIEPAFVAAHRLRAAALRAAGRGAEAGRQEARLVALEESLAAYDPQNAYEALILGRGGDGR